ncbi:MAG: hypothetical protein SFU25_05415 [Candidatus Caenarcaniphilales bacterium]|nr:hypothetical protein [Candidatus Caenarcaniphilales bacterium]
MIKNPFNFFCIVFFYLMTFLCPLPTLSNPRFTKEAGPSEAIKMSSFQDFNNRAQGAKNPANTADYVFTPQQLNEHKIKFQKDKRNTLSVFPDSLVLASLTKPTNPKKPLVVFMYKSKAQENKDNVSTFLNLWINHKEAFNFVLIDPERAMNQYAMLFVKQYWKGENLKALAFDSSGKIRIQMSDVRDLSRLNDDLSKLAKKDANGFKD